MELGEYMQRKKRETYTDMPPRDDPNYMVEYRRRHRERLREVERQRIARVREKDPDFFKKRYDPTKAAAYRKRNAKKLTEDQWKVQGIFDFTYEDFHKELIKQSGRCYICLIEMKSPNVDHCHDTGKYRSLLCNPCNQKLGIFEKHKDVFEKYISEFKDKE
jgi:hypothetical protein